MKAPAVSNPELDGLEMGQVLIRDGPDRQLAQVTSLVLQVEQEVERPSGLTEPSGWGSASCS
jgi:hypothetical protein